MRIHEQIERQRSREAELSALYETARDLTAIRDLDTILAAIVRRARQLLHADMTYLSLNDELEGASYMKVTDGALTPEFRELRLPLGTGLLGLVAQSGAPYFTEDYQADERFVHRDYIDTAVEGEQIRAILGVPLTVEGKVIGALLAVHRTVRPFPAGEVALLTSFAAHAAIALENARLFEQARAAVAAADEANAELRARSEATERAAHAHDLLTDVLLHGGGVVEVGDVLAEVLGGRLAVYDDEGRLLAGEQTVDASTTEGSRTRSTGRSRQAAACRPGTEPGSPSRPRATSTSARSCCAPPSRWTCPNGARWSAEPWSRHWCCSSAASRRRPRAGCAASCCPTSSAGATSTPIGCASGPGSRAPTWTAISWSPSPSRRRRLRTRRSPGSPPTWPASRRASAGPTTGSWWCSVTTSRSASARRCASGWAAPRSGSPPATGEPKASRSAWREARQTLAAMLRLDRTGEVSDPAGLGLARLLLGGNGPHDLEEFVDRTLGPVLRYDAERDTQLAATLEAWLASGGALRETAERLHVHPNTVTQRLDRVGQLLGEGWRQPDRKLDVQLALQMVRLRRGM